MVFTPFRMRRCDFRSDEVVGEEVRELVRHDRSVFGFVVEVDVAGAVDPEEFFGFVGLRDRGSAEVGGVGFGAGDHQQWSGRDPLDRVVGIVLGDVVDAAEDEPVGRSGVAAAGCAVVLVGFAAHGRCGSGLFGGVGDDVVQSRWFAAGFGRAGRARFVEHGVEDVGWLGAAESVAEHGADVEGADRGHRFDAVVGLGGEGNVAAGGADAECADLFGVDLEAGGQERHRVLDVFDARGRIFQKPWQAFAFTLIGGVEGEGHEASCSQFGRVQARGLCFDAAERMRDHDRG
ncbi:hypothetical protein [Nocardia yunnanensis]|uniref:hypothetical protein n=1 Tax=Nocardia yunnanensis TaxID=2382165 RepID=UPI001CA3FFA6